MLDADLDRVRSVLTRETSIDALAALRAALKPSSPIIAESDFALAAVALDANVLLNIAKGRRATETIDYLRQRHQGPLILPAQVVQEFWNNQLGAIQGVADRVRQQFTALTNVVKEIDPAISAFQDRATGMVEEFRSEYGYVLEERTAAKVVSFLDMLLERAISPQVPRSAFQAAAAQRKATKTPPGFRDTGDGDFYVWAEILYALQTTRAGGGRFRHVVLITDDVKKDWSTKGTAHPILCAEVEALVGAKLEILILKAFESRVRQQLGG